MFFFTVRYARPNRLAVMNILAFAVFQLADFALFVQLAHFHRPRHKAIIFAVSINLSAFLYGFDKLDCFAETLTRQNFAEYVKSAL